MAHRSKPLDMAVVRAQLARIVPMLRSLLVLVEDLAENLSADVGLSLRDLPSPRQEIVRVQPRHPTARTHVVPDHRGAHRDLKPENVSEIEPAQIEPARQGDHAGAAAGEIECLKAVAQHGSSGATRPQIKLLTGYASRTLTNYLPRLRSRGWTVDVGGGRVAATPDGLRALGGFKPLPTGDALREWWLARLPEGERRILSEACAAYPRWISRAVLGERLGYAGRTLTNYVPRLRTRQLVEVGRDGIRASAALFG